MSRNLAPEQLEAVWLDIDQALDAAALADERAAAATAPAAPSSPRPAMVLTAPPLPAPRPWRRWSVATAALLSLLAVAFHFLAGGR